MQTADDVHFRATVLGGFASPLNDLFLVHHVAFGVTQVTSKGTKPTTIDADVGRVQVCVDVEVADVSIFTLADQIGQLADLLKRDGGIVQKDAVVQAESFFGLDFVTDFAKSCVVVGGDHGAIRECRGGSKG
jgi:hypothetical protein